MSLKRKTSIISNEIDSTKKSKIRASIKNIDLNKFIKSKIVFLFDKHVKQFMKKNSKYVYIVEDRIENHDFRLIDYFDIKNIDYLRFFVNQFEFILNQWIRIRETFSNFSFYADSNFFDWLDETQKLNDINVQQRFFFINCDDSKLYATIIFCTMYQFLINDEKVSKNIVQVDDDYNFNFEVAKNIIQKNEMNYFDFSFEDWYKTFCFIRYYWRERIKALQQEIEFIKKQNVIVENFKFFIERNFRWHIENFRDALKEFDVFENNESNYELNVEYENDVVRMIVKKRYIDNLIETKLENWFYSHSLQIVIELNDKIERDRARFEYDLRTFKNTRRHFINKKMNRIIKRLNTRYRLIYSEFLENATTIISFIENFKIMIKNSFEKKNVLFVDKFIAEKQNDANDRKSESSIENREKIFKIQKSLNRHIVIANDYNLTCQKFNFHFQKSFMFNQYIEQSKSTSEFKFHQVVEFDWFFRIKQLIENVLLANDMNLKKTIIAFFVIVEHAYRQEIQRFDLIQKQSTSSINNNMSFINNITEFASINVVKSFINNVAELETDDDESNFDESKKNDVNESIWQTKLRKCEKLVTKFQQRIFKSTLIIAFFQTFSIWNVECQNFFFNFQMKIFARSKFFDFNYIRKMIFESKMRHLLEHLLSFFDSSETLLHVIFTFYITFVFRTKYSKNHNDDITRIQMKKTRRRIRNDEKEKKKMTTSKTRTISTISITKTRTMIDEFL